MRKNMILFFGVLLSLLPIGVSAKASITKYNVIMEVYDEKNIQVSENYEFNDTVAFNRLLPLTWNGTNRTISNIIASGDFIQTEENNEIKIELNNIISGTEYSVSYLYQKNHSNVIDLPIADNLNTDVYNMEFTIILPKEIESKNITFLISGGATTDVDYNILGTQINGRLNRALLNGENLTLQLQLPDGYFGSSLTGKDQDIKAYTFPFYFIILSIIGFIGSILCWFKYAKGNHILEEELIYPPNNLDSVEIGFLYKGYINSNDIMTLVLYLATKGYLKIVEVSDGESQLDNSIELVKLKEYDSDNAAQHTIFDALFEEGDRVKLKSLEGKLTDEVLEIANTINNDYHKNVIYQKEVPLIKIILQVIFVISMLLVVFPNIQAGINNIAISLVITGAFILGGIILFYPSISVIPRFIVGGLLSLVGIYFTVIPLTTDITSLVLGLIGVICSYAIMFIWGQLPLRTKYGSLMLGKGYSFKQTLLKMTPIKIAKEMEKNPNYYYDILPYAYELEISDPWLTNNIEVSPNWYESSEPFDSKKFLIFLKNFYYQLSLTVDQFDEKKDLKQKINETLGDTKIGLQEITNVKTEEILNQEPIPDETSTFDSMLYQPFGDNNQTNELDDIPDELKAPLSDNKI